MRGLALGLYTKDMSSLREEQRKLASSAAAGDTASVDMPKSGIDALSASALRGIPLIQSPRQHKSSRRLGATSSAPLEARWVEAHLPQSQIEEIRLLATRAFDDEDLATSWLTEPNLATDEKPPIALLGTPQGFDRVQNLLLRIQYGVLA